MGNKKKIGILLGSFDPIHIDHVAVITQVLNQHLVDCVFVCPAFHNPWKENEPAPFNIRCEMLDAALEPLQEIFPNQVIVNDIERNLHAYNGETVYSYQTLNTIRQNVNTDELYIICGSDQVNLMKKWKNFEEFIKPHFKFIEIHRSTTTPCEEIKEPVYNDDAELAGIKLNSLTNNISSSIIREIIHNGKCPYPLVNKNVWDIIQKYNLYGFKNAK